MTNDSVETRFMNSEISLGVSGFSNFNSSMLAGGLYILIAELPSARFPMLSGSLLDALDKGVPCTIILPSDAPTYLHRIETSAGLNTTELINNNLLHVFTTKAEFSKNIFRRSAEGFVLELEQYGIPENSFFIFEQADDLLALHDIELALQQVSILKQWFSRKNVTALLIFSRTTAEHASTIISLMDYLSGVVRLGGGGNGLELTFNYWQSQNGVIAAKSYSLMTLDSGLYEAATPRQSFELKPLIEFNDGEKNSASTTDAEQAPTDRSSATYTQVDSITRVKSAQHITQQAESNFDTQSEISATNENRQLESHSAVENMSNKVHLPTFGKKLAPRATRSLSRAPEDSSENTTLH